MSVNKLRLLRESHNYSQEYIATKLGIAQNTYSKIETGTTALRLDFATKLADIYCIPIEDITSADVPTIHFYNGLNNNINTYAEHFYSLSKEILEKTLQAKDDEITSLKAEIKYLRKQNENILLKIK